MMTRTYKPTIGLEIHAELKTQTKMFCDSKNDPDETRPNVNVCPVCMGHPGTLPVINKSAVKHVLRVGVALHGELADYSEFDRKNYFYPDIPKGYQISQYKYPLVKGGELAGVKITRVHLEEDTASSTHDNGDYSLVDFNRAGVPLMELVTEPVIHSAEEAGNFARELQLLLRYLGASEANMEKGEMRVEANISVSDTDTFGTKVEVKNLNSFRAAERAIAYEIKRHTELLEKGEKVAQETRGWDENTGKTFSQRKKEDSHDYRYFPDPDLPKLKLSEMPEFSKEMLKKELPELPDEKRARYAKEFSIKPADIHIYVSGPKLARFFEETILEAQKLKLKAQNYNIISNYILSDVVGLLKKKFGEFGGEHIGEIKLTPKNIADIVRMIDEGILSSRGAKDIIAILFEKAGDAKKVAEENKLLQVSDEKEIARVAEKIVAANQSVVEDFKNGKKAALQFLVGQGMKEMKGSANPKIISDAIVRIITK